MTSSSGESEAETRRRRINTRLTGLSQPWQIVRYAPGLNFVALDGVAVEELPTANGPADYALFVGGKLLGFIEAKKVTVNPQNVLEQAKRYAEGTTDGVGNWHGLHVLFLFSSTGELTWFLDTRPDKPASRPLQGFFTPADMFARDPGPARKWLLDTPVETIARLRDYQGRFIEAVESNLLAGRREMLVASATGTGKTFMTVALFYRLLASGFARRILFLVDRKALAAQAVREFNSFNTPTGGKFTGKYELYSQRFQREDFGDEGATFDPKVLPAAYLTHPTPNQTFVWRSPRAPCGWP